MSCGYDRHSLYKEVLTGNSNKYFFLSGYNKMRHNLFLKGKVIKENMK